MAVVTPVAVTAAGVAVTFAAASGGGDTVATGGKATRLHVINSSGSAVTVTFTGVVPCSQGSTHNATATVAAGATEYVQIPAQCIDPSTGNVAVGYSSATSVTVAATQ
jgi:uncharacterized protein (UPF0333 family)